MTKEELIQAISDDKMMPFIQPEQLANIVEFVIKNYQPSLHSNLDEAADAYSENILANGEDMFDAIADGFRAGAEWLAGQGVTFEAKATRKYERSLSGFVSYLVGDEAGAIHKLINQGEEADVIVQIRKKQ